MLQHTFPLGLALDLRTVFRRTHLAQQQIQLEWLVLLCHKQAPSPLMGEGWGEGEPLAPSPCPSPTRGEGTICDELPRLGIFVTQ